MITQNYKMLNKSCQWHKHGSDIEKYDVWEFLQKQNLPVDKRKLMQVEIIFSLNCGIIYFKNEPQESYDEHMLNLLQFIKAFDLQWKNIFCAKHCSLI